MANADANSSVFDVVILGSSGFTGKFVLREFLHCLSRAHELQAPPSSVQGAAVAWPPFSLALAGRILAKLEESLAWAVATAPQSDRPPESELRKIEFMEADALDEAAMDAVCSKARVLVNCVGPCLLYGETIVAACVKAGVHYVDISGEAEFMESIEVKYGERAVESGALIVPGCGSVSSVSDLGLLFHLRQWPVLQARPSSVDAYVRFHGFTCNHAASAETGFISLANASRLAHLRRTSPKKPKLQIPGHLPTNKGKFVHHQKRIGVWAAALPICDRAVVRRTFWRLHGHPLGLPPLDDLSATQAEREKMWKPIQPVHYQIFFGARHFHNALLFSLATQFVANLATYNWGQKLLLRYPEIFTIGKFTKSGPINEEMSKMHFEMWFVGRGYSCAAKEGRTNYGDVFSAKEDGKAFNVHDGEPDVEVVTRVAGPEPAYLTTAINIAQSAMMCLHARGHLPVGGVLTTAAAFGGSHLQCCLES